MICHHYLASSRNQTMSSSTTTTPKGKDTAQGSSSSSTRPSSVSVSASDHHHLHHHHLYHSHQPPQPQPQPPQPQQALSRYESQKRRDWNTFGQYLRNQRPPVALSQCNFNHVLDFLRYLDQFGKTKVHHQGCLFFGQPEPPGPCTCPLRQAWGSLDALIGRLRAAYEENGGLPETNPFASGAIRVYLREVRDSQAKARGIPYKKKKKRRNNNNSTSTSTSTTHLFMNDTSNNNNLPLQ